ncbi:MAG: alpha/beta fold hydrolase [Chloroflexi bacterium]|nr:alpha/beta fold hydrolase [Chloroflexota bacterium]MBT3670936.1 alpha/beta fold hydrolase [Chloroflexota bacterium]MBT4004164.1 alpha/beta fold hydrolase [Chloroflexota bacterium]MBT4306350.1 alpha/beta fold hydrolase [Chloroflexota bacterium]MBT4532769.1 alpha/beta fold hydrolase [Chloroflexota bacterium]
MKEQILKNADPFYFPGNGTGVILVHGFTGAPTEMRWLGEYLNQKGYTVVGPRLAGHGTKIDDMIRTRWTDWAASVEDAWHLLKENTDQIFIIGLSMGGLLSLNHAAQFPVKGVVAMSTPLEVPKKFFGKYRELARVVSKIYKSREKSGGGWFTPEAKEGHISYSANPIRSVVELSYLVDEVKNNLGKISVPTLLIHSKDDAYVPIRNSERILKMLTTKDKELVKIEKAGHVITRDGDKEFVFNKVAEFIQKHE